MSNTKKAKKLAPAPVEEDSIAKALSQEESMEWLLKAYPNATQPMLYVIALEVLRTLTEVEKEGNGKIVFLFGENEGEILDLGKIVNDSVKKAILLSTINSFCK